MTVADLLEAYLAALHPVYPVVGELRVVVRALVARDSAARWWEDVA